MTEEPTAFKISEIDKNLYGEMIFHIAGTLSTGTNQGESIRVSTDITITKVYLDVKTAPTMAASSTPAIIVDVNKNGTTIFTTQGNRPEIIDGLVTGNTTSIDVSSGSADDLYTIDIDQIGDMIEGADMTVCVMFQRVST